MQDLCTAVIGDSAIAGQLSIVLAFASNESFDERARLGNISYTQLRVESSGRAVFVNRFEGVDVLGTSGDVRFTGTAILEDRTLILRLCYNTRTAEGIEMTPLAVECRLRHVR